MGNDEAELRESSLAKLAGDPEGHHFVFASTLCSKSNHMKLNGAVVTCSRQRAQVAITERNWDKDGWTMRARRVSYLPQELSTFAP